MRWRSRNPMGMADEPPQALRQACPDPRRARWRAWRRRDRFRPSPSTLTKRFLSGSFFKLGPQPSLDSKNKKGTMFLLCSVWESDHVEDVCGRSRGFGVDFAVYRDDRGVGPGDPAALRLVGRTVPMRPLLRPLGISRMVRPQGSFRVDSARPRHHHCGPRESAFREA